MLTIELTNFNVYKCYQSVENNWITVMFTNHCSLTPELRLFLTNRGFIHGPEGDLLYSDCRGIILHASGISGLSGGHLWNPLFAWIGKTKKHQYLAPFLPPLLN